MGGVLDGAEIKSALGELGSTTGGLQTGLFSGKSRNPLRRNASMGGYPNLISISHRRKKLVQMTGVFWGIEIYAL